MTLVFHYDKLKKKLTATDGSQEREKEIFFNKNNIEYNSETYLASFL